MFAFEFAWPPPLNESVVRTVACGLALLGAVAGLVGTFAVVRQQSLQGDAISHAALPGVALAFLLGLRSPLGLILGGAAAGWVAMNLVNSIRRRTRIPFDSALAGALSVFFGFGLVLMTFLRNQAAELSRREPANAFERWIQPHALDATTHGLDRYLFGQAAFLLPEELGTLALLGGGITIVLMLFWKELKLMSFDRDFAASLGYPTRGLDLLLTTLVVLAVGLGLRSVGVVLMSSLLVAPATAARFWTKRLGPMAFLASVFGAGSGFLGIILSHSLGKARGVEIPPGPTVVLVATALALASALFAPERGWLSSAIRGRRSALASKSPIG